jgi:hypothetical protein
MDSNLFANMDVDAALFQAMLLQKQSAEEDILSIVDQMRTNNQKKAELRVVQSKLRELEQLAGHKDKRPEDTAKVEELRAEIAALAEKAGIGSDSSFAALINSMPNSSETSKDDMQSWFSKISDDLEGWAQNCADAGDQQSIELQMAMSRRSETQTALTQAMKTVHETEMSVVRNLA